MCLRYEKNIKGETEILHDSMHARGVKEELTGVIYSFLKYDDRETNVLSTSRKRDSKREYKAFIKNIKFFYTCKLTADKDETNVPALTWQQEATSMHIRAFKDLTMCGFSKMYLQKKNLSMKCVFIFIMQKWK